MPTYSFTRTLPQFQALVLRKLRYLDPGESTSADDAAVVNEALDLRLKELHALGVLWFNVAGAATSRTLAASSASHSLAAVTDFLFPVSLSLVVGAEEYPIEIISHREYQEIQSKTDTGEPEKAFFSGSTIYLWPVPNAEYTAKLTYQAIAADTNSPDAPDVPVAMMRALVTLVASDCADDFGVPEDRVQRLLLEAQAAERMLRTLNTERVDTTRVVADYF